MNLALKGTWEDEERSFGHRKEHGLRPRGMKKYSGYKKIYRLEPKV